MVRRTGYLEICTSTVSLQVFFSVTDYPISLNQARTIPTCIKIPSAHRSNRAEQYIMQAPVILSIEWFSRISNGFADRVLWIVSKKNNNNSNIDCTYVGHWSLERQICCTIHLPWRWLQFNVHMSGAFGYAGTFTCLSMKAERPTDRPLPADNWATQ